jgi:hypothetical protein
MWEPGLRLVSSLSTILTPELRLPQRLELYYIINYYIKYVELLDTVFLALKKKPLGPCNLP